MKKVPQTPTTRSRGCLLVSRQNRFPELAIGRKNPGSCVWGGSRNKESLPLFVDRPQKNPPVRPYFKSKFSPLPKFQRASARKHRPPPGTGTEPNGSPDLGAAQAAGTPRFARVLTPFDSAARTGREKLKPTRTRHRNHVNQQTTETKTLKSRVCSNVAHGLGTCHVRNERPCLSTRDPRNRAFIWPLLTIAAAIRMLRDAQRTRADTCTRTRPRSCMKPRRDRIATTPTYHPERGNRAGYMCECGLVCACAREISEKIVG